MTRDGGARNKRRRTMYGIILFGILMVLLFLPLLQGFFQLIPVKPLNGAIMKMEKPKFDMDSYRSGDYAKQQEAYVSEHFGFREPIIRLYNQYLWTFYKKTYAHDVVAGKDGWLYYPQSVNDYYGKELLKWQPSVEEAKKTFDLEVKYMDWARTILKENGIELMVFMAPEKSFVYPEHLPECSYDTTTFNACDYFYQKFSEIGFPCIEMTRWFQHIKDTADCLLIPQTGGHWNFSSVYAADSLFRYMEALKGIDMPDIQIGEWHPADKYAIEAETDLELLLNLAWPIRKRQSLAPEAVVNVTKDSMTTKPKVLFIGNSFFWRIAHYIPLDEMFDQVEFWYYYSTAYFGKDFSQTAPIVVHSLLERLLDFDYVVWFMTGNQMNKGLSGFAQNAVVSLCVDDSLMNAHIIHLKDSLSIDQWDAMMMIYKHPELIPELRGDTLCLKNRDIPYAKITKDIRKDSAWMAALEAQAFLRSATMAQMLHAEVDRINAGKPLYKDQTAEIQFSLQCQEEVKEWMIRLSNSEKLMPSIREKAQKYHKTLEQAIEDDAIWITREKHGLDHCRLIDDPDAQIVLPTTQDPAL